MALPYATKTELNTVKQNHAIQKSITYTIMNIGALRFLKVNLNGFTAEDAGTTLALFRCKANHTIGGVSGFKHPSNWNKSDEECNKSGFDKLGISQAFKNLKSYNFEENFGISEIDVPHFFPYNGYVPTEYEITMENILRGYITINVSFDWISLLVPHFSAIYNYLSNNFDFDDWFTLEQIPYRFVGSGDGSGLRNPTYTFAQLKDGKPIAFAETRFTLLDGHQLYPGTQSRYSVATTWETKNIYNKLQWKQFENTVSSVDNNLHSLCNIFIDSSATKSQFLNIVDAWAKSNNVNTSSIEWENILSNYKNEYLINMCEIDIDSMEDGDVIDGDVVLPVTSLNEIIKYSAEDAPYTSGFYGTENTLCTYEGTTDFKVFSEKFDKFLDNLPQNSEDVKYFGKDETENDDILVKVVIQSAIINGKYFGIRIF